MKKADSRKFKKVIAAILSACLCFQGFASEAEVSEAQQETAFCTAEETVFFEDDFESGSTGKWKNRGGTAISIETDDPRSGGCCMKISDRKAVYAGAELELKNVLRSNQRLKVSSYAKYTQGPDKKTIQMTLFCDDTYYIVGKSELNRNEWGEIAGSLVLPENIDLSSAVLFLETPWTANPTPEQDFMDIYVDDVKLALRTFCDTSSYPSLKELYREAFTVGVAAPQQAFDTKVYSDFVKRQFNSMTMENEMKPAYILDETESKSNLNAYRESAALNFNTYEPAMEYAKNNGIKMRGHTLVWHSQTPEWFFYENYDTSGKRADRELMLKRMENYIRQVIEWTETNYPGVIYVWDVVNEAVADYFGEGKAPMRQEDSMWYQVIGEDFVEKAFEYARKYTRQYAADHEIKLFYNDYNEYFPAKRDGIITLLKPVAEAGNIDGIGMQSHIDTKQPLEGASGYMTAVRKFKEELGLEIQVTELDIAVAEDDTQTSQGIYYQTFMEALLKEKKAGADITNVTFWGINDELSWRPGTDCLLLDADMAQKPAFEGVVNAIGQTADVIDKIRNIGAVQAAEASRLKIEEARNAYENLTMNQKELVSNYEILTEAEARYQELIKEPPVPERISMAIAQTDYIPPQIYTGTEQRPGVRIVYQGKTLQEGTDYTLTFENNINIGTAVVRITGKGAYEGTVQKEFLITVRKNQTVAAGNYRYKITDAKTNGKGSVSLTGVKNLSLKKINVLAAVKIGGKNFQVTAIGTGAFKGCRKASLAVVGKHVKTIGKNAFYGCRKLKKITIKSTVLKSVGKNAVRGISGTAVIKCPKKKVKSYKRLFKPSAGYKKTMKIR